MHGDEHPIRQHNKEFCQKKCVALAGTPIPGPSVTPVSGTPVTASLLMTIDEAFVPTLPGHSIRVLNGAILQAEEAEDSDDEDWDNYIPMGMQDFLGIGVVHNVHPKVHSSREM